MENAKLQSRSRLIVVALCFATILADGFDLVVYGATVPSLLDESSWQLSVGAAGLIGSLTLVGLMGGFFLSGWFSDRYGRRKIMLIGVSWFSVGSLVSAASPSAELFGVMRFFTGIGLGCVVPAVVALTAEYAPRGRKQLYNGLTLTGYSFGGIVCAVLAIAILPDNSWRWMYAAGGVSLVLVVVMYFFLPESVDSLIARGREHEGRLLASQYGLDFDSALAEYRGSALASDLTASKTSYQLLLSSRFRFSIVVFILMCSFTSIVTYGLVTWLPQIMRKSGYPLGSALQFLVVLQIGAIIGMVGGSFLADRMGSKRVLVPFFLIGASALFAMIFNPPNVLLMLLVGIAGLGTTAASTLINGYIASYFPASCRASAVGLAQGLGRLGAVLGPLLGGWIVGSNLGIEWSFLAYALPAVIAAGLAILVPNQRIDSHRATQSVTVRAP